MKYIKNITFSRHSFILLKILLLTTFFTFCFNYSSMAQNTKQSQAKEELYQKAINKADKFFNAKNYKKAKLEYQKAHKIKPDKKYPETKVKEIDNILNKKSKYDLFAAAITNAEKYLKAKNYRKAKFEYENALKIDPSAQYPKDKIEQINKIYKDPEVETAYNKAIKMGDDFFNNKDYKKAKINYQKALKIKPNERYTENKINKINDILTEEKALKEKYDNAIANADNLLNAEKYKDAKIAYQNASLIINTKQYPKDKIKEINKILAKKKILQKQYENAIEKADKLYIAKDFELAKTQYEKAINLKPDERYPKNMLEKINSIYEKKSEKNSYNVFILNANKLFNDKNYENAKKKYQKASTIRPDEQYPKNKINIINKIIANQNSKEESYNETIANADKLFNDKDYENAKKKYQKASTIKPDEQYPKNKINNINKILSLSHDEYNNAIASADKLFYTKKYEKAKDYYQKASSIKPDEQNPKDKISEINNIISVKQNEIKEKYDNAISTADKLLKGKDYENAISEYTKASKIKPEEQYPENRINEINNILNHSKEQQASYNKIIGDADDFFNAKRYEKAKKQYQNASDIKPEEKYPEEKIEKINKILDEIKSKEESYNNIIANADKLFEGKNYEKAKIEYKNASNILPDKQYPIDKIKEINNIIITTEKNRQKSYNKSLAVADSLFDEKDYINAKKEYQNAINIIPDRQYPIKKINIIKNILIERENKRKESYKKTIALADSYFNSKIYDKAIDAYQRAINVDPADMYPANMIEKIKKIISDNSIINVDKSEIYIYNNKKIKFPFKSILPSIRKNNYISIKLQNLSSNTTKIYLNYGKDNERSGGFVFKIKKGDKIIEKIIRISNYDMWFRVDNNWLSLYSEGGDIKILLIQISQAD